MRELFGYVDIWMPCLLMGAAFFPSVKAGLFVVGYIEYVGYLFGTLIYAKWY